MKLLITATLSEEEILTLAKEKWWSESHIEYFKVKDKDWNEIEEARTIDNVQTASDFIVNIYQSMIANDASSIFIKYKTKELQAQITMTEDVIKNKVSEFIIWSVE